MKKIALTLLVICLFVPHITMAATLTATPSDNSVNKGDIITVRLTTNTQGKSINEAGGTLQFPVDMLEAISVSKSSSIFSLWVDEPRYSNSSGTVVFDGGVPNPGFTGSGEVLSVTFKAKRAGLATLSFTDAAVRANDGFGTNILSNSNGTEITITDTTVKTQPAITPVEPAVPSEHGSDSITNLVSLTHPDQSLWYSDANPSLSWSLPTGALAVETTIGETPSVTPTVLYQPAISSKQITNVPEGSSYFNIRAKTKAGWGPVASYHLHVDTIAPNLGNPLFSYDLVEHQLVITNLVATDTGSGIAKFELILDGGQPLLIRPEEISGGTYRVSYRTAGDTGLLGAVGTATGGTHGAVLYAYDFAGNSANATGAFVVPVALIDQSLLRIFGVNVTLLWFILLISGFTVASLIAAIAAWYRLYVLRQSSKSKVTKREQVVHRALSLFRTDLERHIKTLEATSNSRVLTNEEEKLRIDLTENLSDLERYLKKEFKKFD